MKFILTDIEGTTTSISFVHEVLFPYSYQHLHDFLNKLLPQEFQEYIEGQKKILENDLKTTLTMEQFEEKLKEFIRNDVKNPVLKNIQGAIWRQAYEDGAVKGHVYKNAHRSILKWHNAGYSFGIYSSGSVEAQKLLFQYSDFGDMTPYFKAYFDTKVGHKREENSYRNILRELNLPPEDVVFLSDIIEEVQAAKAAGMHSYQVSKERTFEMVLEEILAN